MISYFDCFKNHNIAKRITTVPIIIRSCLFKKRPMFRTINPAPPTSLLMLNIIFFRFLYQFLFLNTSEGGIDVR